MSFFITLIYLFCIFIRPQDWMPALEQVPVALILVGSAYFFLLIELLAFRKEGFAKVPQNRMMLGFMFAILMSHLVHTYFDGIIKAVNDFLIIFLSFYLILNALNTKRKFTIALWMIVLMIFFLAPQGIYQNATGVGWAGQKIMYEVHRDETRINWVGIFSDPNDLVLTFNVAVGIILAFIFGRVFFLARIINLIMLGYLFYGIYLTNSRGGIVSLVATMFFYFTRKTKRWFLGGIIGTIAVFGIFAFGPSRVSIMDVHESSAMGRVELWYNGILMIKANPIFGVGYDMFMAELPQTAHNSFILATAELGFVGLFFWMALIYCSFRGMSIIQENDPKLFNYALGLQTALISFCVAAFFLSRTYVIIPYIIFALCGALMHIAKKNNPSLDFKFTKQDFRATIFISILVLCLAYGVIKLGV